MANILDSDFRRVQLEMNSAEMELPRGQDRATSWGPLRAVRQFFRKLVCVSVNNVEDSSEIQSTDSVTESVEPQSLESSFHYMKTLGHGYSSKVLLVRKKDGVDRGTLYALKVIKKALIKKEEAAGFIIREQDILAFVQHPFVMDLRYSFQTPRDLCLALPFLPGGDLFSLLCRHHKLPEDQARFYAAEIILGLEYIHSQGIIYRDLKPENTLIDSQGHVKLTDFGLAKRTYGFPTKSFCGTETFMAPELVRGQMYNKEVDWWAMGVVIHEMVTGSRVFDGHTTKRVFEQILWEPLVLLLSPTRMSNQCLHLLFKLLKRDPEQRLGHGLHGSADVKAHPFFAGLDWNQAYQRDLTPPIVPELESEEDTQYFEQATNDPEDAVVNGSSDGGHGSGPPWDFQSMFQDFDYTHPLLEVFVDSERQRRTVHRRR